MSSPLTGFLIEVPLARLKPVPSTCGSSSRKNREWAASGLTTDMIQVDGGGSATAVVAGLTIEGGGGVEADRSSNAR